MSTADDASPENSLRRIAVSSETLACSVESIAEDFKRLVDYVCRGQLGSFTPVHDPLQGEKTMAAKKLGSFSRHSSMKAGASPALKGDTVSIGNLLNTDGTPYTGPAPTWTAVPRDLTILSIGTIVSPGPTAGIAATYPETFLAAGTDIVDITATVKGGNPDGTDTVVTQQDTVVLAPAPGVLGSFTVTHSL
jgi:hypothetical protein